MKLKTIFITFLITIVTMTVCVSWLIGSYFIDFAFKRGNESDPKAPPKASTGIITPNLKIPEKPNYKNEIWNIKIDNENRTATAFYADRRSNKWIVLVHGYCRDQRYTWSYADEYLSHGFNVLTPDLNASGNSDGLYLTMGIKESIDVAEWVRLIAAKNPRSRIVMHGVSMGAATVMLAAENTLPDNVFAVVEDCGYTSATEMFEMQFEKMFGISSFPFIDIINGVHMIKQGCFISDAKPIRAVKKSQLPILFIHGDKDKLVPVKMAEKLYEECNSKHKEKYIAKGAGHARSVAAGRNKYFSHVYNFISKAEQIK